jgi:type I restriction enzyme R subunit
VHSNRPIRQIDSVNAVSKLFHVAYWFARTYGRASKPSPSLTFDPNALPRTSPIPRRTLEQLQTLEAELAARDEELAVQRAANVELDAEVQRLREEIAAAKAAAAAQPDTHDYSEAETRDHLIDLLLREAGWQLADGRDREFNVSGMPTGTGVGFVDYVLWGDDGKPLGLMEAKRTKRSHHEGQHQAKLYADCLEAQFGQRPVIFCSNGYEHQIWDDQMYPPRSVQGFLTKDELQLIVQRRATRTSLAAADINREIVERYYQTRSIRRIGEAFEQDKDRKALVVMATGAGKTRTVIALCDVLMRCNWVKRVLFLADRKALVKQAENAFKRHLPDSSPVNLIEDRNGEGRVFVSTYPTMMGLIDELSYHERRFGVGYFDLIVIDEAHRSVFQKYRAIFDYFDSLLVGLTATPREEIDRNTYSLFDLETGVPTDAYALEDAVNDGFLVPPLAVSVPLKFQREGIRYDDLPDDDKARWDELDWDEDGNPPPDEVAAGAINRWLFNADTVDKVLEHLMTRGQTVAGGDRLAKTIVFAANQEHARFIVERFDANYPHYRGEFARVITHSTEHAQDLIDKFSIKDANPHIAVSVDMLDTGIDVPEVVNLVFFKLVRSKTKFWQMLGRGTRLCPDLFGPGLDKRNFLIFDFCQNLEYFSQNPQGSEGVSTPSLHARLFRARLALLGELDAGGLEPAHRASIGELLRAEIASMHPDNFIVRPKRRLVERFATADAWQSLNAEDLATLANEVAGLPNQLPNEPEESKRFDLLMLNLQLTLVRREPEFTSLRDRVIGIASVLEESRAVPDVARELELIQAVQTDDWWQGVTLAMLENVRVRLRSLVTSIERRKRKVVYTDFEDEIGLGRTIDLAGFDGGPDYERFLRKVRVYVFDRMDTLSLRKVYNNFPLTETDIDDLRRIIHEAAAGTAEDEQRAAKEAGGFGVFIRSLVGLDRNAAKEAFAGFLDGKQFNATQIEFINLVIDHLAANGIVPAARFYESPFTDLSPTGPDGLFTSDEVDQMIALLDQVRRNAGAA